MAEQTDDEIEVEFDPVLDRIPLLCAVSLFRPKVRNSKYRLYYDSLLQFARRFKIIFKDFILRVYYDGSLFSTNYTYKDEDDEGWDGHTEDYYWSHLLCVLKGMKHVQLARVVWKKHLEDDGAHHRGLIGTLFRFHAMLDPTVNVAVIRDIDGNVVEADYESIIEWIPKQDKPLHYYYSDGYKPDHLKESKELYEVLEKNERPFVSASMFATKELGETSRFQICKIIKDYSERIKPNYGNDEIILNWIIMRQFLAINIDAVKTWDFYVGVNEEDEKDNLWWKFKNIFLLATFSRYCEDNYHFKFDINETPPPESDEEGTVNYAGYLSMVVHSYFKEKKEENYILWDQLLGGLSHLFPFKDGITVNNLKLTADNLDELWEMLNYSKQEYELLLPDGSLLDDYSVLDHGGEPSLELTLRKIKINEFSDLCCSICSTPDVMYSCTDCGQVFCKNHKNPLF